MIARDTDVRSQTSAAAADRINGYLSPAYHQTATFLQRSASAAGIVARILM
jgi:hypothetical protein